MKMTPEDVTWIYRIFLGREPESEDAINYLVESGKSRTEVIETFMASDEFAAKHTVK